MAQAEVHLGIGELPAVGQKPLHGLEALGLLVGDPLGQAADGPVVGVLQEVPAHPFCYTNGSRRYRHEGRQRKEVTPYVGGWAIRAAPR